MTMTGGEEVVRLYPKNESRELVRSSQLLLGLMRKVTGALPRRVIRPLLGLAKVAHQFPLPLQANQQLLLPLNESERQTMKSHLENSRLHPERVLLLLKRRKLNGPLLKMRKKSLRLVQTWRRYRNSQRR
jgi:hypothetical protein